MSRSTNRFTPEVNPASLPEKSGDFQNTAYALEFLTPSGTNTLHSRLSIGIPRIEIGRDPGCIISYDKSFTMVSKKHAALERNGNDVLLKHLSSTNQTLLNGTPIEESWYLNHGDIIQLSPNGPKIRYLSSATFKAAGFTQKFQLYAQQKIKPYKWTIIGLAALIIIGLAFGIYFFFHLNDENQKVKLAFHQMMIQKKAHEEAVKTGNLKFILSQKASSEKLAEANSQKMELKEELENIKSVLEGLTRPKVNHQQKGKEKNSLPLLLQPIGKNIYYLKMYLSIEGQTKRNLVGTGTAFLSRDGYLVTTRQCIQPWAFADINKGKSLDEKWLTINWLYYNSKDRVQLELEITGSDKNKFTINSEQFIIREENDFYYDKIDIGYGPGKIQLASSDVGMENAFYKMPAPISGFDNEFLDLGRLPSGTILHMVGYPNSFDNNVQLPPLKYLSMNMPEEGRTNNGISMELKHPFDLNPGSLVFIERENQMILAGIISAPKNSTIKILPLNPLAL